MHSASRERFALLVVNLIVGALIIVPPLVRATYTSQSAPIRLNRGFDAPPAKSTIDAPQAITLEPDPAPDAAGDRRDHALPDLGILSPDSPDSRSPDPFRGPPPPSRA